MKEIVVYDIFVGKVFIYINNNLYYVYYILCSHNAQVFK